MEVADMTETAGKIVVGSDGSVHSRRALDWAGDEARRRGVPCVVVHAYAYGYAGVTALPGNAPEVIGEDARRLLEADLARLREMGVRAEGLLAYGAAAPALTEASTGALLLVVGSRGRGGVAGAMLGSVSSACVHHAHCPIVVIPPPDRSSAAAVPEGAAATG